MKPFTVYGWRLSYFTAKINCYFNYKKIPNQFKVMNAWDLFYTAPKYAGASVMPIIQAPDGTWMQDTRDIIEKLEGQFPEPSVFPNSIELRFLSNLLEAWGDEFWIPFAMHYRWRYPENVKFFKKEANAQLLPAYVPSFFKNHLTDRSVKVLSSFLPLAGGRPEQHEMIELWTKDILSKLDSHFAASPYLLGDAPTIADFGLAGPLVAHLCRDPHSKNVLMVPYRNVLSWSERIQNVANNGKTLTESATATIPSTLTPIIQSIINEFVPMIRATVPLVQELLNVPKFSTEGKSLPRILGEIEFPLLNNQFIYKRRAMPFHLWKFQKVIDEYNRDPETVKKFLSANGLTSNIFDEIHIPPLQRKSVRVKFLK